MDSAENKKSAIFWSIVKELPNEDQAKIHALIDDEDEKYFAGPMGVMLLAALSANQTGDQLKNLELTLAALKTRLDETRDVAESLDGALQTAYETALKSFGAGLKKTLPSALGETIAPALASVIKNQSAELMREFRATSINFVIWLFFAFVLGGMAGAILTVIAKKPW